MIAAHRWLTECFEPVVSAVPENLLAKRDPAQIYHEVLDYRWYQSEHENREVPLLEATHGYIRDVLSSLPDEAMSSLGAVEPRQLANPYDPSFGYAEEPGTEDLPAVHDPWEDEDVDVSALNRFSIEDLRKKAAGEP